MIFEPVILTGFYTSLIYSLVQVSFPPPQRAPTFPARCRLPTGLRNEDEGQ